MDYLPHLAISLQPDPICVDITFILWLKLLPFSFHAFSTSSHILNYLFFSHYQFASVTINKTKTYCWPCICRSLNADLFLQVGPSPTNTFLSSFFHYISLLQSIFFNITTSSTWQHLCLEPFLNERPIPLYRRYLSLFSMITSLTLPIICCHHSFFSH